MIKFYLVVYCKDETIHLWPGKDKEDCRNKLIDMCKNKKLKDRILSATIIQRDVSKIKDGLIFGSKNILESI